MILLLWLWLYHDFCNFVSIVFILLLLLLFLIVVVVCCRRRRRRRLHMNWLESYGERVLTDWNDENYGNFQHSNMFWPITATRSNNNQQTPSDPQIYAILPINASDEILYV